MRDMVVGFMYSNDLQSVLLIEKNKPEWQAGLLNGVGGKIEDGESPISAMIREFFEETGHTTISKDWEHCITYKFYDEKEETFYKVFFLAYMSDLSYEEINRLECPEDEELMTVRVDEISYYPTVTNLQWLVPLLADMNISFSKPLKMSEMGT